MSEYAIYDVFTDRPFGGNPLAVVFGAGDFDAALMQRIAGEFNLSETCFVGPAEHEVHTARLRIFTPSRELPFAGHPTVGAAIALAERRVRTDLQEDGIDLVEVLEEEVGPVRCAVQLEKGRPGFAEFDLPRLPAPIAASVEPADVAAALGLGVHEIGFENHVVSVSSAGVPFVLVPVHDMAAAAKARMDMHHWLKFAPLVGGVPADCYLYCRGGEHHDASFHARMFAPSMGIAEDPATGAAVAALAGAIHRFDGLLDGHCTEMIEQGVEMGRPSHIHLHLDLAGGKIKAGRIGGQAVKVAEGKLLL
ncbi:PhzF family phenazine biosynthesis protein [Pseudohoeflea coraliihabitans]|uniref:PhzF family phenazine biosynthesis protein n=1 Tax=Pseudohoeflea coraliihabitans TaxID=2860393 RepID=A0ABS6WIV2_9HYPH|nr:PhzF family phenazine biosynthesis protein [Pseudohoeflea sp. DP4N28-3]MBW3095859.1 PhzF family phenazine biosynthesis protein [Pseudohoeflea sp. DP4N28-3]